MAAFHLRRDETDQWRWKLVDDDNRVIATSPRSWPTKGEANAAVELVRRELTDADTQVDTVPTGSRWKGIDMATGQIQDGPASEPEETHDEGETGPPEVDLDAPANLEDRNADG